jgi:enamine deaminase RidA (YjgF/YER057c/UK114 family)
MSKTAITSPELAPPVGPYSQAVDAGGFIYFSGQVGQDPFHAALSGPHDDWRGRAAAWGLRGDRPRRQGLK